MNQVIYHYKLPDPGVGWQRIKLPFGSKIVHVGFRPDDEEWEDPIDPSHMFEESGDFRVWVLQPVNPVNTEWREFCIVETGEVIDNQDNYDIRMLGVVERWSGGRKYFWHVLTRVM